MHNEEIASLASSSIVIAVMFGLFLVYPPFALEWGIASIFMSIARQGPKK